MTTARRATLLQLMIAAAALAPAPAMAQPSTAKAEARKLSAEGDTHFGAKAYDRAIASYQEAYRLVPLPPLLFNTARAYRLLGACDDARIFFQRYLASDDSTYRDEAQERIAAIDAHTDDRCVTRIVEPIVRGDALDPRPAGPAPSTGDRVGTEPGGRLDGGGTRPDPVGPTVVAPTAAGPDAGTITIAPSGNRTDPDGRQAHAGRGKRIAGLVTAGVGVGLIGTGGYFSAQARDAASDVEDACTNGCVAADVAGRDADGKTAQRNPTIFYAAGGAAIAIGATLAIWGWRDGRTAADHVTLVPSRTGAIAVAGWSF